MSLTGTSFLVTAAATAAAAISSIANKCKYKHSPQSPEGAIWWEVNKDYCHYQQQRNGMTVTVY